MATQIYPTSDDPLTPPNIVIYTGHILEWGTTHANRKRVQITTPDGQISMPLDEWHRLVLWIKSFPVDGEPEPQKLYVVYCEYNRRHLYDQTYSARDEAEQYAAEGAKQYGHVHRVAEITVTQ